MRLHKQTVALSLRSTLAVALLLTGSLSAAITIAQKLDPASPSTLLGVVRSSDGKPLGGVMVSARAADRLFTTSVVTDEQGEYVFPTLPSGQYKIWAQAVGFATTRAELTLDATRPRTQPLSLQPLTDFAAQLSGIEWLDSLPDDSTSDRRMKQIVRVLCTDCHNLGVALVDRFDERGWLNIIKTMESTGHSGWAGPADPGDDALGMMGRLIRYHREELAKYLARMRGPGPSPMKFKLLPRPTGDAARVVVTEFDIPIGERPNELAWHDGSDWSDGPGTGMHGAVGLHDVITDVDGNVWLTENRTSPETHRSLTRLDINTGKITAFKALRRDGKTMRATHAFVHDPKGNIWIDANGFLRLDPKTETFSAFFSPTMLGNPYNHINSDSQGRIWGNGRYGSMRFDPATNKWQLFQQRTPGDGFTYGVAADADDNGWWSQFTNDLVVKADVKTGKSYEVVMHDPQYEARKRLATPADLDHYDSIGGLTWGGLPANVVPYANAPRRLYADTTGNTVWVPNWAGMNLAGIDIHTLTVTYYPLPIHGHPYNTKVDKNHNVWADVPLGDRIVKLEPKAGQWTVYMLPSIGCNSRNIHVDDWRSEVWLPCDQTSKVARFQFRTGQQIQAQKAAATALR